VDFGVDVKCLKSSCTSFLEVPTNKDPCRKASASGIVVRVVNLSVVIEFEAFTFQIYNDLSWPPVKNLKWSLVMGFAARQLIAPVDFEFRASRDT